MMKRHQRIPTENHALSIFSSMFLFFYFYVINIVTINMMVEDKMQRFYLIIEPNMSFIHCVIQELIKISTVLKLCSKHFDCLRLVSDHFRWNTRCSFEDWDQLFPRDWQVIDWARIDWPHSLSANHSVTRASSEGISRGAAATYFHSVCHWPAFGGSFCNC